MYDRLTEAAQSVRAATRTAYFFLEVLPMMPSRLVDWMTPEPVIERVRYPTPAGEAEGDLYLPGSTGVHPGVVVCLGVVPFGVDHPQVPRLGRALARAGFAALLYWSPAMRDLRLDPDDARGIALAYRWLIDQPRVDARRSGLLGTCVGGSFALMAAADAAVRDRVGFIIAWAPFASMRGLARDIASASTSQSPERAPWQVDQLTRKVFVRSLTADLEPEEAALLRDICSERGDHAAPNGLSSDGRRIFPLLTALDVASAEAAVEQLPAHLAGQLECMSPLACLDEVRAPVIVLAHDADDQVVPVGESRRIAAALEGRPGTRYTEFRMFKHLDPTQSGLPRLDLARELGRFYRSVYPAFRCSVGPGRVEAGASPRRGGSFGHETE